MWLTRDTDPSSSDPVVPTRLALLGCPPRQVLTLSLSGSSLRGRAPVSTELRAAAATNACRIAVAETRGIAVRWVDALVCGTAEDLVGFLDGIGPALRRTHARAAIPSLAHAHAA